LNVLMITTDQQRWDTTGFAGNPVIRTPHLDRLAAEGMVCDRSYAASPVCTPSRASMLTGRYPRIHGAWNVGVDLPAGELTAAQYFREHGYETAVFGKMHLRAGHDEFAPGREQSVESIHRNKGTSGEEVDRFWSGFTRDYYGFERLNMTIQHGNRVVGGGHYDQWLRTNHPEAVDLLEPDHALESPSGAMQSWKAAMPPELHYSRWIADTTVQFLREREEQPFFIWCSFPDPHHPLCPPAPYCDMYPPTDVPLPIPNTGELECMPPHYELYYRGQKAQSEWEPGVYPTMGPTGTVSGSYPLCDMPEAHLREMIAYYYGLITLTDEAIGSILLALDELGLAEDTIVVFNSDHGDLLGDHGLAFKGPFPYEGIIRVPTVWRWPGVIPAGAKTSALMSHVDLFPTLAEACELEVPRGVQGVSQLPVLKGEKDACRDWVLMEFRENPRELELKTIVTDRYKLTYYPGRPYGELFDLRDDPQEKNNLWDDLAVREVREQMKERLLEIMCETEDPLPVRYAHS
jgi:arylsulfatase A-like enzyme